MSQPIGAFFLAAGAAAINGIVLYHDSQDGSGFATTVLAGIVMGTIAVALNNATNTPTGTWLAAALMLASILKNGVPLFQIVSDLVGI